MAAQSAKNIVVEILVNSIESDQQKERPSLKVSVKRISFPSSRAMKRYYLLKDAARQGVISDFLLQMRNGRVWAFTYKIQWRGDFYVGGLPFVVLERWRAYGYGYVVGGLTTEWGDDDAVR